MDQPGRNIKGNLRFRNRGSWTADSSSGIEVESDSVDAGGHVCTAWLAGGNISTTPFRVTNEITTAAGRTDERSLLIKIQPR